MDDFDHLARFTRRPCRGELHYLGTYQPTDFPIGVYLCSVCTFTEFRSPTGPVVRPPSPHGNTERMKAYWEEIRR